MKKVLIPILIMIAASVIPACREKNGGNGGPEGRKLLPVAKGIITDVIVKADTAGDPWEAEKVKGFDGREMFRLMLENVYNNKYTVYAAFSDDVLNPEEVRKSFNEYGADPSKIGKLQFTEDWFFDPSSGNILKKTRSVTVGYEIIREQGLPPSYKVLFRLVPKN